MPSNHLFFRGELLNFRVELSDDDDDDDDDDDEDLPFDSTLEFQ